MLYSIQKANFVKFLLVCYALSVDEFGYIVCKHISFLVTFWEMCHPKYLSSVNFNVIFYYIPNMKNAIPFSGYKFRILPFIMFHSIKSAWGQVRGAASSVKETLVSSIAKGRELFNAFLPPEVDHRPAVRQQVGEVLGKGRLDNVILDLPSTHRNKFQRPSVASATTSGLFNIQRWASADESPLGAFYDFNKAGMMDETPMTPSFYTEVRSRAIQKGRFDFDPLANLNHGLQSDKVETSAPVLSKLTRMVPEQAAPVQEGGAQIIPFRRPAVQVRQPASLADAWLTSPKTFNKMVAETRASVGQTLAMAA